MKQIKKIIVLTLFLLAPMITPVYAAVSQGGWDVNSLKGATNLPDRKPEEIMLTVIDWAIVIVGLLCVIIFIYGGFLYLTAQGETDRIETAKKVIIYAVIGVAVSVLGYVAVKTVNDILVGNVSTGGGGGVGPAGNTAAPAENATGAPSPSGGGQLPVAPGMMGQ